MQPSLSLSSLNMTHKESSDDHSWARMEAAGIKAAASKLHVGFEMLLAPKFQVVQLAQCGCFSGFGAVGWNGFDPVAGNHIED